MQAEALVATAEAEAAVAELAAATAATVVFCYGIRR
jgi:hypothetical protein